MQLNIQTFAQYVQSAAAAAQSALNSLRFNLGSIELAVTEAAAAIAQWLQSMVVQVLATTRLSTSSGSDVDSFVADFGLTRLPAVAAVGQVTLSSITPASANVPVYPGIVVATANAGLQFTVIADATQSAWDASLGAYVMAGGLSSVQVTVQCQTAGTVGNVSAAAISLIQSNLPGIDAVTNASAFTSGVDVETDTALKTRFQLFVQGLKQGTEAAVASAIANLQQGLTWTYTENQAYNGTAQPGYFYVVVDDGSGYPPSSLLTAVTAALNAVRPCGVSFGVFAPVVETAAVSVTVTAATGYTHANVAAAVQTAIQSAVNALVLGQSLYWSKLYAIIYAVPGVQEATNLQINGTTSDLAASQQQVIKSGTITVS